MSEQPNENEDKSSWSKSWDWGTPNWDMGLQQNLEAIAGLIAKRLWLQILIAMALGLTLGLLISPQGAALLSSEHGLQLANWLKLPGAIFLNLIQMIVIPLVVSSIILGICASGDTAYLKRAGVRIFPYFVCSTIIAVSIGVVLTLYFEPGKYIDISMVAALGVDTAPLQKTAASTVGSVSLPERLADLIPTNIDKAMVTKDMLQIVIYAIILGIALLSMSSERSQSLIRLLESVQDLSLKIVGWAMRLAPYAVFGLIADIAIRIGLQAILAMSAYVATVILGLVLLLLVYVLLASTLGRQSPISFMRAIRDAQLLAFSTSSSAAVMPLSMQTAEQRLGVKASIGRFIVPLGATINMDGTALYQVVAALFLTQVFGIDLSSGQIILLIATTVGASIGSPSTPGVGIVILATILADIGVPASGIALIIGVDRILDMCRTAVNVSGDLTACCVMNHWLEEPAAEAETEST